MLTYMKAPSKPTYYTELDDTPKNRACIVWRIQAKQGLYTYRSRKGKVGVTGPRQSLVALLKESGGGRLLLTRPDGETQSWDILPAIPSASPTYVSPTRSGSRESLVALLNQSWDILPAIPSASPTSNVSPTRPGRGLSDFEKKGALGPAATSPPRVLGRLGPIKKSTPVSPLRKNNPVLYWTLRTVWFILKLPFIIVWKILSSIDVG
jgi:hypothetical protein